ncbi:MAG: hypothetical protein K2X39_05255, partial [Silvanigrellaceae bacterium]|nr:hypothetical protein [Silvanigrellaceae bacterium]
MFPLKLEKKYKAFVAGGGNSGVSVAKLLQKHGIDVFVSDAKQIAAHLKTELLQCQIPFEEHQHSFVKFDAECDFLVTSPGIPLHLGLAKRALEKGISIVSEIEVTSWFIPKNTQCIAITGTNGKSTVTHYTSQLFSRAGYITKSCGNIGTPFSQTLLQFPESQIYVLEMSSYQIETTWSLAPQATIFLNIQPDHLARYENMDEYFKAKWRLVLLTDKKGVALIEEQCFEKAIKMGLPFPDCTIILLTQNEIYQHASNAYLPFVRYSKNLPMSFYHEIKKNSVYLLPTAQNLNYAYISHYNEQGFSAFIISRDGKKQTITVQEPCIPGIHNAYNLLAASLIALHFGIRKEVIVEQ